MARVSLKKDFKDGDKLYGQQLNNNFGAIEAALDTMNKIVWQDDPDDTVVTFRGTTAEIQEREIIDGQLLYDTSTGETYIDYNGERISTGSGNAIFIGEDEPTNNATQLWIDPTEPLQTVGTEVVNSLEGNETNKAPSVAAAKTIAERGSNDNGKWLKFDNGAMICWGKIEGSTFDCTQLGGTNRYYYVDTNSSSENAKTWTYPQEFVSTPNVNLTVGSTGYTMSSVTTVGTSTCTGICVMPYSAENMTFRWYFVAIGRWK